MLFKILRNAFLSYLILSFLSFVRSKNKQDTFGVTAGYGFIQTKWQLGRKKEAVFASLYKLCMQHFIRDILVPGHTVHRDETVHQQKNTTTIFKGQSFSCDR